MGLRLRVGLILGSDSGWRLVSRESEQCETQHSVRFNMNSLTISTPLVPATSPVGVKATPTSLKIWPGLIQSGRRQDVIQTKAVAQTLTPVDSQSQSPPGGTADAMGLLLRERIVFLGNQIDDLVADAVISQLLLLDAQDPTKDIRLFINSPGGSLSATMAIFDVLQLVRADVSTIALGIAASTASIILGGGTKGKRLAMPNTRIMLHQPLGGASGQAIDVEIQAKEIMHNKTNITHIIAAFTGRSFHQVQKDIDRDRYMSPMEAVEYGIIDAVIDKDTIIPLMPVPPKVKPRFNYEEIAKDPKKFLTPDIPDDEIY